MTFMKDNLSFFPVVILSVSNVIFNQTRKISKLLAPFVILIINQINKRYIFNHIENSFQHSLFEIKTSFVA